MPEQPDIDALLEESLVLQWYLPVMVDAEAAPLVWVDPAQRQDLLDLQQRRSLLAPISLRWPRPKSSPPMGQQ
jgi:hypothetical protein